MSSPTTLDNYFISDESRILGDVLSYSRVKGRVSALMKKDTLPDGNGFNFSTVITDRSIGTAGEGWQDVLTPNDSGNHCTPVNPSIVAPATTQLTYNAAQKTIFSEYICFTDARRGYMFEQQVANQRKNYVAEIVDTWEYKDTAEFINASGQKIVFNSALTTSGYGEALPAVAATSTLNQDLLDALYIDLIRDGAGDQPYAMANGTPLLNLVCSFETSRGLIKGDASIREDFRFAEMGEGSAETLLKTWNTDKAYGGYMHIISNNLPRYNFVNGEYVEVPFYISVGTTLGSKAIVNPAYKNAAYEATLIWHPDVVHRMTPKPLGSVGADTSGDALGFNGEVKWLNIPSQDLNPFSNQGRYGAQLMAAYKPGLVQYGITLITLRCPRVARTSCPSYS